MLRTCLFLVPTTYYLASTYNILGTYLLHWVLTTLGIHQIRTT